MLICASFQGISGHGKEFQGNTRENHVKMHGNEWIKGSISHDFIFLRRGMQYAPTLGPKAYHAC